MKTKLIIALAFIGTFANAQIQNFNTPVRFKNVTESNVAQKVAAIAEDGTLQWINRDSIKGQEIDTSKFLVKDSTNTVTSDFAISNEDGQSINFNGDNSIDFTNPYGTVRLGSDEGFALQYNSNGNFLEATAEGIAGSMSGYDWYLSAYSSGHSRMTMPITGVLSRTLALSVNGNYADLNGNIDIDLPNTLKKNEENVVTSDFSISNEEGLSINFNGDYSVDINTLYGGRLMLGSDDDIPLQYDSNVGNLGLNLQGAYGEKRSANSSWRLYARDNTSSRLEFPNTGQTYRVITTSVNGNYADENGNIEINELPTPPETGCHTLQANNGVTSWIPCTE